MIQFPDHVASRARPERHTDPSEMDFLHRWTKRSGNRRSRRGSLVKGRFGGRFERMGTGPRRRPLSRLFHQFVAQSSQQIARDLLIRPSLVAGHLLPPTPDPRCIRRPAGQLVSFQPLLFLEVAVRVIG